MHNVHTGLDGKVAPTVLISIWQVQCRTGFFAAWMAHK